MKRIINFPPFYHPKDNIDFTTQESNQLFHLIRASIKYNYITNFFEPPYYYVGVRKEDGKRVPFSESDINIIGNQSPTLLSKEIDLPKEKYPDFYYKYLIEDLDLNTEFYPTSFVFFVFNESGLFEVRLKDRFGETVNLNTKGEIINRRNQRFIEWL